MAQNSETEVWQRGPIDDIPALLQPAAHALLQAVEDVEKEMASFPPSLLWEKPAGVASVGFHLKHLKGVLERLFTYSRGEILNEQQLEYLKHESVPANGDSHQVLVEHFKQQVARAIDELKGIDVATLTETRGIGRKQIPTTVIGLIFHAAEHSQRHVGQLLVTARMLKGSYPPTSKA